ncbi:MAG: GAF domain-containing protein, partial [Rhodothermia bacterium]|nr:GAF domain-containing protein [Rhodothermia bacterium]
FQTILDGFDEQWSAWTSETRRDYTNLPFGDYVFRARARNVYGVESAEAAFAFTILPPWYRTWWAYVLYALALGSIVFAVDRVQRRRVIGKERERAHLREAELRAESAEAETRNVELLSKIGREITSRLSIKEITETVYESVNSLMDASVFSIGILNEEENRLDFPGSKEKGETMTPFYYRLDDDRLASWCFHNRSEVLIQDYAKDHLKYLKADQAPVSGGAPESVLYLPLIHKDRVIGVISAQSFEKNAYTDFEVNILRNLATYAAIAIDNAEAYQRLNNTLQDLRAAQDRLVQSEKMASLGQLTAGIAHEIKNPLNFVNNFAAVSAELTEELVEEIEKNKDKKLAEVAEELREILSDLKINANLINEHGKRADGIVKSMLQHSRGDEGEQMLTDVNTLLDEYVNLAYHGMRASDSDFNSSIERDYDESAGSVMMVPQEIGRVLINLLNNAFYAVNERAKSSTDGYDPTVSVWTKRTAAGVSIGVKDNGTGIPESVKVKIFEPFFTTKPTGLGTGLGLSMSYEIVSKGHGGDLKVESKAGEYTHFVISLPGEPT